MERRPGSVTVIIPAYQCELTIGHQLTALARQTYEGDLEVIVADNGSRDTTKQVIVRAADILPNLRIIDASDRRGAYHARNVAAAHARGDLLLFCDADDVVDERWIEAMSQAAAGADLLGGRLDPTKVNDQRHPARHLGQVESLPTLFGFLPFSIGANLGVWRVVFEEVGGFRDGFRSGDDLEFCWRAQLAGFTIEFVPGAIVNYRYRDNLPDQARQFFRYGLGTARIYKNFRACGLPDHSAAKERHLWFWLTSTAISAVRDPARRGIWVGDFFFHLGRLVGGVRHRSLAPAD